MHLERRRAWRHNPSRTPREYVRLLKTGSAEQRELRGLTSALEQSWYGQREANAEEFGAAKESFERLAGRRRRRSVSDARWSDRRIVLWMGAVILLLIVVGECARAQHRR